MASQTSPWCLMETVEHGHNTSPPATPYKEIIFNNNIVAMFNWLTWLDSIMDAEDYWGRGYMFITAAVLEKRVYSPHTPFRL